MTISDDLPNRILVGAISVHDNVARFTSTGAVLQDGSTIEDIDVVILATGFKYSFPFLEPDVVKVEGHFPHLYEMVFPPNNQPCSLAVVGLVQPFGALPPILEMQARAAAAVFSGNSKLPDRSVMESWIRKRKDFITKVYVDSPRYSIQVYFIQYLDSLGKIVGCQPSLRKHFFTNPRLWSKLVFGPSTPPQWRLDGHGRWEGAAEAIENVELKTYYPMKTRQAGHGEREGLYDGWLRLARNLALFFIFVFILRFSILQGYFSHFIKL